ncbi:Transcriptional coactivator p15 (PC4) C-terminal domain-containing protein [Plasmodiophora brassicae]|uniref:Transcriptional coactivator p15 (PC4) C-terminal domain-containing protein n=1 Tax=Plasmodiophora brassicae TaxID=37360 RepID=A0A3P3Y1S5_PLABS|nr:unnamed protein product [Plasmodiophora brassicae]
MSGMKRRKRAVDGDAAVKRGPADPSIAGKVASAGSDAVVKQERDGAADHEQGRDGVDREVSGDVIGDHPDLLSRTTESIVFQISDKRRVSVRKWKKSLYVDIREYYEKNGETLPGSKGISLSVAQWQWIRDNAEAIDAAVAEMT